MSYNITYNHLPGSTVWIEHESGFFECILDKIILNITPEINNTSDIKKLYHVSPKNESIAAQIREENKVFSSSSDVINYMIYGTEENITPSYNSSYNYTIYENIWWQNEDDVYINGNVTEINILIEKNETNVFYTLLPTSSAYSLIQFNENITFDNPPT